MTLLSGDEEPVLKHPHIVPVLKTTQVDGRPALVMPLYTGGSLEARIRPGKHGQGSSNGDESFKGHPLPIRDAIAISLDVLSALNHAHEHQTIHRDVKPANILLDHEGRAYLSDFGTATEMKRMLVTRFVGGTPLWTSPEQIRTPRNVGHLADVYSFGCCLYDMLSGRPPFDADEEDDTAGAVLAQIHRVAPTSSDRRFPGSTAIRR